MSMEMISECPVRQLDDSRHWYPVDIAIGRRRREVVLHGWHDRPVDKWEQGVALPAHEDVEPRIWWRGVDFGEIMVVMVAVGVCIAYGTFATFVTVVLGYLVAQCGWHALIRRVRQSWRSWRTPGRHRVDGRPRRFCPA
ncbi:hypothetical protein [Actinophytocola sediminis]